MRGLLIGIGMVAVLAGPTLAEPPENAPAKKSWFGWPSFNRKARAKDAAPKEKEVPSIRIDPNALKAREKAELGRRLDVCLRLREIALQTRDEDLSNKAFQLEQKAYELFYQRMAQIGSSRFAADEQTVQRRLASDGRAASRLANPANAGRASAQNRAAAQEE